MDRRFRIAGIGAAAAVLIAALLFAAGVIGPTRWPAGAILVPRDAATVQDALDQAARGATIVLQPQREPFVGPFTIRTADITLRSARGTARVTSVGADPAVTVRAAGVTVRGLAVEAEAVGLRVEADGCTLERIRVASAGIGIQLEGARGCTLERIEIVGGRTAVELVASGGNTLRGMVLERAAECGVRAVGSWDNALERLTVRDIPVGLTFTEGSSSNILRDSRVERSAICGAEIRGADGNTLSNVVVRGARIGVLLDGARGSEISACRIDDAVTAAIFLQQASQSRVLGNEIGRCAETGILLSQSSENALLYNRVAACNGAGIHLAGGDRNLLLGNRLAANGVGIESDRSSRGRILRNEILMADRADVGLLFVGGSDNRFLDNAVRGGGLGLVLSESQSSTVLRNRIEGQATAGVCLDGSQADSVTENRISGGHVGLAILGAARSEVLHNVMEGHEIGLLLAPAGPGARIEGNRITANGIGLKQTESADLPGLPTRSSAGGEITSPVLVHNTFARNRDTDIVNETAAPIRAVGNWAEGRPTVEISGHVLLDESAWQGTVTIGAEADLTQEILGRLVQLALVASGFHVIDLIGIEDSGRLLDALRAHDVDFVWWSARPPALAGEESFALAIPAARRRLALVSKETAARLDSASLSSFAAWAREQEGPVRYAATSDFDEDSARSFEEAYGLSGWVEPVTRAKTLPEAEALLKLGAVHLALLDNLEETLTFAGYVPLEDDRDAFQPVEILAVARAGLIARHPEIERVLERLAGQLTLSAIHDLASRVRLLHRDATDVARDYLVEQGLLGE